LTASVEELRVANEDLATRTNELSVQATALEQEKLGSQEERDRLRSILTSLGDAVVAVDHDGEIVMSNNAYARFFGGPTADVECEDAAGLPIPEADRPRQRAARGERFRMELRGHANPTELAAGLRPLPSHSLQGTEPGAER